MSRPLARVTAAALACASLAALAQVPEFRVGVEAAYVDVFVSRGDAPVVGLGSDDFELRDEGVPQPVAVVASDVLPIQALFVFDSSSSLTNEKRAALRRAGEILLAALRPADEAGLLAFSAEIFWLAKPTRDRDAVRRALARMEPIGATSVYDALLAALAVADPRGRTLIILFTDGRDNTSALDASHLKAVAERTSALVHLVTVRDALPQPGRPIRAPLDRTALDDIAEATGGRVWVANSVATLGGAFERIAATLAARYVLRYEPRGEPKPGWHRLEVKLRKGRAQVHARRGYWAPEH
ncbi:MAG: VWA domain-containing protein [Vicinamibacteria bacterium]|nr:VWA domain-containing protein [Vicinamibacteria bacterium]